MFESFEHLNFGFVSNFGIRIFPLIFLRKTSKFFLEDTIRFHNVLIGQYQSVFGNKKPSTPGNLSLSVLKRSMRHILCVVRIVVGKIKKSLQSSSFLFYYHLLLRKKQFPIIYHLKVQEQGGVKCQL